MRTLVHKLIEEIRKLPEPTFSALSEILTPHRASFETDIILPEEYAAHWHLIKSFIQQLDEALQSEPQVALKQKSLAWKSECLKKNKTTIESEKATIAQSQKIIDEHYLKLHDEYRDNILESESHQAILNSSDHKSRIEVLKSHSKTLKERQTLLKLEETRLLLNEKSTRRSKIIEQLHPFSINVSSLEIQLLQTLIEEKQERYTLLFDLEKEFQSLMPVISTNLAAPNVELKIAELKAGIQAAELSYHEADKSLKELAISIEKHDDLEIEYSNAIDKEQFIESKKSALTWHQASYNPLAMVTWMMSNNYETVLTTLKIEYNFVQLLHKKHSQLQYRQALEVQLQQTKSQSVYRTDDELAMEAARLLKIYKNEYTSENKSLQILLSDMVDYTIPLHTEIEELHASITLLNELKEIDNTILQLRTEHSLISDLDEESLLDLKATANTRQDELKELELKLNNIALCVSGLETITASEKSINDLVKINKGLRKKELKDEKYITQASQTQVKVSSLLDELKALSPVAIDEEPQMPSHIASLLENLQAMSPVPPPPIELEQEPVRDEIINPASPYAEKLEDWNKKICALTHLLPEDLSLWYEKLYSALSTKVCDEKSYHQICQLLRDICFELEYPVKGNNFSVLYAYQKMSPKPEEDCQAIIDIKLPFPVDTPLLAQLNEGEIKNALNNLYTQQEQLEKKHVREALLLLQATHNLHHLAIAIQNEDEHPALANLKKSMSDPRYSNLHEHRGFLKVCEWLAKLATALLNIVRTQPENSYRQRFFFVPTRSVKRLEETAQEIISCGA